MKVVDVNPFFYPFVGGIEHRMHLIAKEMVSRGHDVTIVTGQLEGTELNEVSEYGYKIVRLPSTVHIVHRSPRDPERDRCRHSQFQLQMGPVIQ